MRLAVRGIAALVVALFAFGLVAGSAVAAHPDPVRAALGAEPQVSDVGSGAPAGGVVVGGELGDGVDAGARVLLQRAQAGVTALGHQQRQRNVGLGEVGERRVAQLVQRPAAGRLSEELLGPAIGQPRSGRTAGTGPLQPVPARVMRAGR
jgi:hypothetical protein